MQNTLIAQLIIYYTAKTQWCKSVISQHNVFASNLHNSLVKRVFFDIKGAILENQVPDEVTINQHC